MPRVTNAPATRARRKRTLKLAKGYFGNKSRLYVEARDAVERAQKFAYRDRREKKTEFRQLWIVRINAACRPLGITYSRLIQGLLKANIVLDRKSLSELAIHDAAAFEAVVKIAREALEKPAPNFNAKAASAAFGKKVKFDDLTLVEGIGPKIAALFVKSGISTWALLAKANPAQLKEILANAGSAFSMHEPATWPAQAALAAEGKFAELKKLQVELDGGRVR